MPSQEIAGVDPVYYMSHGPAVKLSGPGTKTRPVSDVPCYNGCLSSGPALSPDLVEVVSSLAHCYYYSRYNLQISVQEKDRDVHRFSRPRDHGTMRDSHVW